MRDGPGRCGGRLRESGLSGSVASRGCREVDGPRWCHSSGVSRLCGAASLLSGGVVPLARRVQCAWRAAWYRIGHLVGARVGVPNVHVVNGRVPLAVKVVAEDFEGLPPGHEAPFAVGCVIVDAHAGVGSGMVHEAQPGKKVTMQDRVAVNMAAFGTTVAKTFWMSGLLSKMPVTDVVSRHPTRINELRMQKGALVGRGRCTSPAAGMVDELVADLIALQDVARTDRLGQDRKMVLKGPVQSFIIRVELGHFHELVLLHDGCEIRWSSHGGRAGRAGRSEKRKIWLIRQNGERSMNQAVSSCRHSRFGSECDSNAFRYRLLLLTQVLTATNVAAKMWDSPPPKKKRSVQPLESLTVQLDIMPNTTP